jgi:methionyl-tRNA formyltransferase
MRFLPTCTRCAVRLNTRPLTRIASIRKSHSSSTENPLRILFFGSDTFSTTCLDLLCKTKEQEPGLYQTLHVVTKTPARIGRGRKMTNERIDLEIAKLISVPTYLYTLKNGLPVHMVNRETVSTFESPIQNCNLIIAVSFGLFIPPSIIQHVEHSINVHPSLLPRYRGPAPIHNAILNGDKLTGVSLQTLSPVGFDKGVIFDQSYSTPIEEDESLQSLWDRLANIAANMLVNAVRNRTFINPEQTQTFTTESYAERIDKTIDWEKMSADKVVRLERVVKYPSTGLISLDTGQRIDAQLSGISPRSKGAGKKQPGDYFLSSHDRMVVVCGNKETVYVDKVKVSGKNWITGRSFLASSPYRFWGERFVPKRKEYEDHFSEEAQK